MNQPRDDVQALQRRGQSVLAKLKAVNTELAGLVRQGERLDTGHYRLLRSDELLEEINLTLNLINEFGHSFGRWPDKNIGAK
jgi:hypothetical protein